MYTSSISRIPYSSSSPIMMMFILRQQLVQFFLDMMFPIRSVICDNVLHHAKNSDWSEYRESLLGCIHQSEH